MHDMKAHGRVELQLYSFLISALGTGKWLAYDTGSFTRTGKAPGAIEREAG